MCRAPPFSRIASGSPGMELNEIVVSITVMPVWFLFHPVFKHLSDHFSGTFLRNSVVIECKLHLFLFVFFLVNSFFLFILFALVISIADLLVVVVSFAFVVFRALFLGIFFRAKTLSELNKNFLGPFRLSFFKDAYV